MTTTYAHDHTDWHTAAAAEGTPITACPFDCLAAEGAREAEAYTIIRPPDVAVEWKCPECKWSYTSPIPLRWVSHLCPSTSRLASIYLAERPTTK